MQRWPGRKLTLSLLLALLAGIHGCGAGNQGMEPIVYTMRFPEPESQMAHIEASFPTEGRLEVELMMPVWSPGYYRIQDYASKVQEITARTPLGEPLQMERSRSNRWLVRTGGADPILVHYQLYCPDSFVTTNWVGPELLVLNGGATYITLVEGGSRPHEVRLELAPTWGAVATGLPAAPGGEPNHFRADDFDILVDSPIVAGDLEITSFEVAGVEHLLVDVGERGAWDPARAARDLQTIIRETLPLWGGLPYDKYVFLNVFRRGGGGLEHGNSTLLTTGANAMATPGSYRSWLNFATHEYFHAFNVKRLRPVELGPFDYEVPPRTSSLWISEGLTSYFAGLFVVRAGLATPEEYLTSLSSRIARLQGSPGRLLQSLEQSSLEVWINSSSGIGTDPATVSYYLKGEIAGFLLDARIRKVTGGQGSLQDVMRLSHLRYGGERGFTPEEFQATAEEVAGVDLADWFERSIASAEELDYGEVLEWYGLRFAEDGSWRLERSEEASVEQEENLKALFASARQQPGS